MRWSSRRAVRSEEHTSELQSLTNLVDLPSFPKRRSSDLWLNSERYNIEAKVDESVADRLHELSFDQRLIEYRHMLQTLLKERFGLVFHWETKELPVYALVVTKSGQIGRAHV